jgi:hypothetical protein
VVWVQTNQHVNLSQEQHCSIIRLDMTCFHKATCLYDGHEFMRRSLGSIPVCLFVKPMNSKQLPQVWETIHTAVIMNSHREQEPDLPSFHPFQASFSSPGHKKKSSTLKSVCFKSKTSKVYGEMGTYIIPTIDLVFNLHFFSRV